MAKPTIEAISTETLPEFAAFLAANMTPVHTGERWIEALSTSWSDGLQRPNHGFLMRDQGQIVGGIGAIYARRIIRGQPEDFCNITSWCVLDSHRKYGMQLAMAVVAQPGYHFTDFSPTKVVGGVLQFLKFKPLDEGVVVIGNLPASPFSGAVISEAKRIERELSGPAATVWRDHVRFPWLRHLLLGESGNWCHVIYKREQFKGLPCARIVHLGDASVFERCFRSLAWHFVCRGMVSTHVERRFLAQLPWPSRVRTGFNRKVYLSPVLTDADIDCLYSESVALNL
jgi:hypothetical protein